MWATGYCGYDWVCVMRIYHIVVYLCVYIVANKTCDSTEPCFQSASVRLCVQKNCLETKRQSNGHWKRFSMISKKATFNGKQPSCFHISTPPIPVFLGMYNSFMTIWELQWQLRKTWRSEWCLTFHYEGKNVRVAACPTTPSNARWSLKIVLLSFMLFQLEMIWNCSLMVQVGWEPTSIVWGFGWRLWEYESDRMARYNCEMNALKVKT